MPPNPRRTSAASRTRVPLLRREDATLEDDGEPSADDFSQQSRPQSTTTSQSTSQSSLELPRAGLPGAGSRLVGLGIRHVG